MSEFSEFIRHMRKAVGLTTDEFANLVGCSRSTISNYECGIKIPNDTSPFESRVRYVVKKELRARRGLSC